MPIPRANLLSWHSNLLPTTAHDQLGRGKMPLLSSCDENSRTKLLNVVGNSTALGRNTGFLRSNSRLSVGKPVLLECKQEAASAE